MSAFSERIKRKRQVMIAGLISHETKTMLDEVAQATRRSKSGCLDIALRQWLLQEKTRIKGSETEVLRPKTEAIAA